MTYTAISSPQSVFEAIKHEFDLLGLTIENVTVDRINEKYYQSDCLKMSITFICEKYQVEYLKPFIQVFHSREEVLPDPVRLYAPLGNFPMSQSAHTRCTIKQIYSCTMVLALTGGDVSEFIESFRNQTSKLRYIIESGEFDKEVEKMLTDDRYNN